MKNIYIIFLVLLIFVIPVAAQDYPLELELYNEVKVVRLAPDALTGQSTFVVDGGATVRIHVRASANGVSTSISCPNGQTVNSGNISSINGIFNAYEITPSQGGISPSPYFAEGFHSIFEFPIQGTGSYSVSFNVPSGVNQEVAVLTNVTTDSSLTSKLFSSETSATVGKPIVLSAAIFDEQAAVAGATVTAQIKLPDGSSVGQTFSDDGQGADYLAGDGIYSAFYIPTLTGNHRVLAQISGVRASQATFQRSASLSFIVNPFVGRLTGNIEDYGVDEDNDNLLNKIVVKTEVETTEPGDFGVFIHLKVGADKYLIRNNRVQLDTPGMNYIEVDFDAESLVRLGENGPYAIELIELVKYDQQSFVNVDSLINPGQTQAYQMSQLQRPPIIITNFNQIEGLDFNGNSKFDVLSIKVGANVVKSAVYVLGGTLYDQNDERIDSYYSRTYLTAGENTIEFLYNGGVINLHGVSGVFKLKNVFIRELKETDGDDTFTGAAISVPHLLDTPSYDVNQFENQVTPFAFTGTNSAAGIDINSNGKYEFLRINSSFYSMVAGGYNIQASLKDSNGNVIQVVNRHQQVEAGMSTLQFDFDGGYILNANVDGPLTISDVTLSYGFDSYLEVPVLFTTQPFNSNQFEVGLEFTGQNTAEGIDENSNGKYEFLRINSEIYASITGSYSVQASLKDAAGNVLQTVNAYPYLYAGTNTIQIDFNGVYIFLAGIDGPLTVADVTVSGPTGAVQVAELFVTQPFNSNQFDRLPSNLNYMAHRLVILTGDGDSLFEPGETAQMFVRIMNNANGIQSGVAASLSAVSTNAEILSAASAYPSIDSFLEKENLTPFVIKLKEDAPRNSDISLDFTFDSSTVQSKTATLKVQTGLLGKIVYIDRTNNLEQIYQMNSDGGSKTNLSNSESNDKNPVIAPNGTKIAFLREGSLFVMNADGTNQLEIEPSIAPSSKISWSSDSSKIAYERVVSGFNRDIYVIDASGGQPFHVTQNSEVEIRATWLPNSNKLAFGRGAAIYTINSDGTGESLLTTIQDWVNEIEWSPDGNLIGWVEGYGRLSVRRISTGTNTEIDISVISEPGISWSPDSKNIAYVRNEYIGNNTYADKIIYFDTENNSSVEVTTARSISSLAWSPDGRKIAFSNYEEIDSSLKERIRIVNFDGSGSTSLFGIYNPEIFTINTLPRWRPLDITLPTSTISNTPSANADGWNSSDTTVGILATDNQYGSGLQNVSYNITGAQTNGNATVNGGSATFSVFTEGISTVNYAAKDNADNFEPSKTFTVKIDKSNPISRHTLTAGAQETSFTLNASDAVSGVSNIFYSIDGATAQIYSAPFTVSNTGGHSVSYYAKDFAGNEETPRTVFINPSEMPKSVLISEFRTRGYLGADDEFVELYNNSDISIDISGWTVSTKQGSNSTAVTLATINSGAIIPARGHYLLRKAGTANYSLSAYAEADQTYTGALAENIGIALISLASVKIDAVGFSSVADATYREGTALAPSAGISANGQYSFIRNYTKGGILVDSNNNKADFIFVATDGGTYNNLKAVLGSPGPENLNSPIYREGNVLTTQIDDKVTLAEAPNRFYDYATTSSQYPVGILSVRRKLTNNTGGTINTLRLRIIVVTTKNSAVSFPQQAVLRQINSSDVTVTSIDGQRTFPLKGLTIETIPTTIDGGLNSTLTFDLGTNGLANGQSVNIDLKSGIVTNGQYRLEFRVETSTPVP